MTPNWQRERAKTRQPYLAELDVPAGTPCSLCGHGKGAHSLRVMHGPCRMKRCECKCFDAKCRCEHELTEHQWSTAEKPFACAFCQCARWEPFSKMPGRQSVGQGQLFPT